MPWYCHVANIATALVMCMTDYCIRALHAGEIITSGGPVPCAPGSTYWTRWWDISCWQPRRWKAMFRFPESGTSPDAGSLVTVEALVKKLIVFGATETISVTKAEALFPNPVC